VNCRLVVRHRECRRYNASRCHCSNVQWIGGEFSVVHYSEWSGDFWMGRQVCGAFRYSTTGNMCWSLCNKSVFSYLRTLTKWHCTHLPAGNHCCSKAWWFALLMMLLYLNHSAKFNNEHYQLQQLWLTLSQFRLLYHSSCGPTDALCLRVVHPSVQVYVHVLGWMHSPTSLPSTSSLVTWKLPLQ